MPQRPWKQTDYMRELVCRHGRVKEVVCAAYAQGERDGLVVRKSNKYGRTPEQYAVALWAHGNAKGWL